jgi:CRP-like cAMP-binding protein
MPLFNMRNHRMRSGSNRLLEGLPRKARNSLLARCDAVELVGAQSLHEISASVQHIYFPTDSILSLWTSPDDQPAFEFSMVGNEGMLGAHVALGVSSSATFAQVLGAGKAWRMRAAEFRRELVASAALQRSVHRYLHVMILQGVSMARCSRFHSLSQRLARWLLMTQDRSHKNTFLVTQELMASMLGVRRVGVSIAATALQRMGIIEYVRGEVKILDRRLLEASACACYAADRQCYARFLA